MTLVDAFVRDGFVSLRGAFSTATAAECCDLLWAQLEASPDDPSSWSSPVVRLGYQSDRPFAEAVNTPRLHAAYDALVGEGRWMRRADVGTFVIRFPSPEPLDDDGWHIDASFPPADPSAEADPFAWRVNIASRGRALLMLMLFSDVGAHDAPTRLRVGSHRATARLVAPHGGGGLSMIELSSQAAAATDGCPVAFATGRAGDVYLCHPFLVHAAQPHRGTRPRVIAQPPLHPPGWISASLDVIAGTSPVEVAIRQALQR